LHKTAYYSISDTSKLDEIKAALEGAFTLAQEKASTVKETYYDTFDSALYKSGWFLTKQARRFSLREKGREKASAGAVPVSEPTYLTWADFPEGRLRAALREAAEIRALLPLITLTRHTQSWALTDAEGKTVARIRLAESVSHDGNGAPVRAAVIEAEPVRGYGGEFETLREILSGLGLEPGEGDILSASLVARGETIGTYSSKVNVSLDPNMPSGEAIRKILAALLDTMKKNEDGMLKDIDTEFLHDFRVSVRRSRSALTLTKNIYTEEERERWKEALRTLGKMTNRLRDLDIYLLGNDNYVAMVPPSLRPGLKELFSLIAGEREKALQEFTAFAESDEYRRILYGWGLFLDSPESQGTGEKAGKPVIKLARKRIKKRYKSAVAIGSKISGSSPDADFHTLRIECKKLRYYLEFFESLFPGEEAKRAIKQLKALQDNLGDFNDLHVQQESIKGFLSFVDAGSPSERDIVASAGGLISCLYARQEERRSEFASRFEEFAGDETKALFDKMLSGN
jgi:CHAD domain-containing protein